jgi:membrane protease YdiL (CAAX protease family)
MEPVPTAEPVSSFAHRMSWPWRVVRFPLARIVLGTVAVVVAAVVPQLCWHAALKFAGELENPLLRLTGACVFATCACLGYAGFVRVIEWRWPRELGRRRSALEALTGAGVGAVLMSAVIGVMAASGAYRVEGTNSAATLVRWLGIGIGSGVIEELVFRCLWLRVLEEWLGSGLALFITSAFFGFGHAFNPGATLWSDVSIALEAGILLGAAFLLTRRLWLAAGVHAGWNFTQGGVFGANVSGGEDKGFLQASFSGPDWLTGGAFGPEASVIAQVVCTSGGLLLLALAVRRGAWVPAFWRRLGGPEPLPAPASPSPSGIVPGFLPLGGDFRQPTPAEDQAQAPADGRPEDRSHVVDEP